MYIRIKALGLAAAAVAAHLASTPALAADTYTIDGNHTMPMFEVNHMGVSTQRGRFNKAEGKVSLDIPARKASVNVSIPASNIDMGLPKWTDAMQDEGFFFVERYPTILFKADHFNFEGDKPVSAMGELTLLGQTHPVHLTIANFNCKPHPLFKRFVCGADLTTTIKRSDWGMVKHIPLVGDEVKILIPIEAIKDQ
jgi:polyisoprenoid-binding protein YceI